MIEYLGGKCVVCTSQEGLEIDHIDPSTKCYAILARWNKSLDYHKPELEKCQLLCVTCHLSKTVEMKSVGHGEGLSGKKNCKCVPCKTRKSEYNREYRRSKKLKTVIPFDPASLNPA